MEKFSPSGYHSATAFFSHCSSCICFAVVAFWIRYLFLSLSHFWGRVMWCFGEKRICTLKKKDEKKISSSDTFCLVTSSQRAWELHNKDRFYFCYWKLRSSLIILSGCEYPGSFVYLCFSLPSILAIAGWIRFIFDSTTSTFCLSASLLLLLSSKKWNCDNSSDLSVLHCRYAQEVELG